MNDGNTTQKNIITTYEQYQKYFANKYFIKGNIWDIHEVINIVINFILIGFSFYVCWKNNYNTVQSIFTFVIIFIAYDIVGIFLDFIVGNLNLNHMRTSLKRTLKKFSKMTPEEKQKHISQLKKSIKAYQNYEHRKNYRYSTTMTFPIKNMNDDDDDDEDYYDNEDFPESTDEIFYRICQEELELCQSEMDKIKEMDKKIENAIIDRNLSDIEKAKEIVENLKKNKKNCPKDLQEEYMELVEKSNNLLSLVKEKPTLMDKLNKTFNIYFKELVELLIAYRDMSKEEKQTYYDTISDIIKQFKEHLEELEDYLNVESKMNFEVNSSLLLESLKKERNE